MNKLVKILILFVAVIDSYAISNCILNFFLGAESAILKTFLNYSFTLIAVVFVSIFFLKISRNELFSMIGIKKRIFNSILISIIFILLIFLFNLAIFLMKHAYFYSYYPSFFGYLLEFSTSFSGFSFSFLFVTAIFAQIYAAFAEEFIFRGIVINIFSKSGKIFPTILAVVLSSSLFALWHLDFSPEMIAGKFAMGLLFSSCFIASGRNSASSGILHSVGNLWFPANLLYLFYL